MTLDHDAMRAQVVAYFDGEVDLATEADVVAHLGECAACQALLGDTVGLDAAAKRPAATATTATTAATSAMPPPSRRRTPRVWVAGVAAIAAAAVVWMVRRPTSPRPPSAPLALAAERSSEVRWSAPPFSHHRPYQVARGSGAREAIPLAALAQLEATGDRAALAAALAATGDVARADQVLAATPDGPAALADRAALALVDGDPERALTLADQAMAAGATTAAWNRALALRELEFPLAAAAQFDAIHDDPAWRAEATQRGAALREDLARRRAAIADVIERGKAMVSGAGPALSAADAATSPASARVAFVDAVRVAADPAALDALAPLAEALDAQAPPAGRTAVAALTAARTRDFARRAPLVARYRAILAQPDPIAAEVLARDLDAAGATVDDLAVGLAVIAGTDEQRLRRLERRLAASTDPWFTRLLAIERATAARPTDATTAESLARSALLGCSLEGADLRCARLAYLVAELALERGALEEASALANRAVREFARAGDPTWEDYARPLATELDRVRGAWSRARGGAEEALARAPADAPCWIPTHARMAIAEVARFQGDIARARAALPSADACPPIAPQHLITVIDLALQTGDAVDRARATAWVDAARPAGGPILAIADGLLASDRDPPAARRAFSAALASPKLEPAMRALAYRGLARAAAAAADWSAVVDDANAELGRAPGSCDLVISPDDFAWVVAARTTAATVGARLVLRDTDATPPLPAPIVSALDGCAQVAVIARPPVHGRAVLLPPERPWSFVTARAPVTAVSAAAGFVVVDVEPPAADARLPRLGSAAAIPGLTLLTGAAATPRRVLSELATAGYAELHVHGIANLGEPGTSFLALSPDPDGDWKLTAADVAAARFTGHPVVVLGACRAAAATPRWDARWSLPDAFLAAGARAVIAADVELPDRQSATLFARLRARLTRGEPPAVALAAERAAAVAAGQTWAAHLTLFE